MEQDHRSVDVEGIGMIVDLPAIPMKIVGPKEPVRSKLEIIRLSEPEPARFSFRAFWHVHGIHYQPSRKPSS